MRTMLFMPVRLRASVATITLKGLERLLNEDRDVFVIFYDDNEEFPETSALLHEFCRSRRGRANILSRLEGLARSEHSRSGPNRGWSTSTVDRIIEIKNHGIRNALEENFDYAFLLDADMIPHPRLIHRLIECEADIVAGITWTRFHREAPLMPNCWDYQTYNFRSAESIIRLRVSGVYEVGGLAAATLYSRRALIAGVCFSRIPNLEMWGEDKHLSVRAACLGFRLFVCTDFPLFHMYRDDEVQVGEKWLSWGCPATYIQDQLNEHWEAEIRKWWSRSQRAPEGSLRRKMAGRLRWLANLLDPK